MSALSKHKDKLNILAGKYLLPLLLCYSVMRIIISTYFVSLPGLFTLVSTLYGRTDIFVRKDKAQEDNQRHRIFCHRCSDCARVQVPALGGLGQKQRVVYELVLRYKPGGRTGARVFRSYPDILQLFPCVGSLLLFDYPLQSLRSDACSAAPVHYLRKACAVHK